MKTITELKKGCLKCFGKYGQSHFRLCPTCQALLEYAEESEKLLNDKIDAIDKHWAEEYEDNSNRYKLRLKEQAQEFEKMIERLIEYEDIKIKLAKENLYSTKEERDIHISCCIDTKMKIKELLKEVQGDKE
jgi:ribosomal protein S15P/S13E